MFVWKRNENRWSSVRRGAWVELVASEDPNPFVDRLCGQAGLTVVGHPPPHLRQRSRTASWRLWSRTPRLVDRIGSAAAAEDTSGNGGGVRRNPFDVFVGAASRLRVQEVDDLFEEPAYGFSFMIRNDEPVIAIEASFGDAWTLDGRQVDLLAQYRSCGHRVWPVVWHLAPDLLP